MAGPGLHLTFYEDSAVSSVIGGDSFGRHAGIGLVSISSVKPPRGRHATRLET